MKKIGLVAMPVLAISFLTNCNKAKSLDDYSWEEIKEISATGEANKHFKIGDTKKVQLKLQDTNENGEIDEDEVYQTVRIIDFNKDFNKNYRRIGITFEFVDKISDGSGLSLATYWNDYEGENTNFVKGLDYENSSIRKALVGKGNAILNWFGYYGEGSDLNKQFVPESDPYHGKNVLDDMIPDDLKAAITPAYKLTNICIENPGFDDIKTPPVFKMSYTLDPLFLLSPGEIGFEGVDMTPCYKFYEFHNTDKESIRAKTQINKETKHQEPVEVRSGNFKPVGTIQNCPYSYAGCITTGNVDDYTGNEDGYWLRSPSSFVSDDLVDYSNPRPCAWGIKNLNGYITDTNIRGRAYGIAPAFCI